MANKDRDNEIYKQMAESFCEKHNQYPYLKSFMDWLSVEKASRTVYYYLVYTVNFLDEINKQLKDITLDDYTSYAVKQKKYTPSNQIAKYSAIKSFATYAVITNKITNNFMINAPRPKSKEKQETIQKREKGFLTPAEIQMVISNIQNGIRNGRTLKIQGDYILRDMAIVLLFLSTGMRSMALENLDVNDIDLDKGIIIVTDKEDKVNTHFIPDDTKLILKKWIAKRKELLCYAGKMDETALFISNRKERISYGAIKAIVCKYCSTITGKNITPHKLRATYGTMLYNKTHDIEFVRQQMNHSNVATTQKYIRGNKQANKQKAADIMGDIISNRNKTENLFEED